MIPFLLTNCNGYAAKIVQRFAAVLIKNRKKRNQTAYHLGGSGVALAPSQRELSNEVRLREQAFHFFLPLPLGLRRAGGT